jgi:hypothetical protein
MKATKKPLETETIKLETQRSNLELWAEQGIDCTYVKFHQDIPPGNKKEPVAEFKTNPTNVPGGAKYVVDRIIYTPNGLIYTAFGETNIVPLANVVFVRPS